MGCISIESSLFQQHNILIPVSADESDGSGDSCHRVLTAASLSGSNRLGEVYWTELTI